MRQRRPQLELAIESPCTESWDNMSGTLAQRHCSCCQKHVHNFAAMTPRQIERTLAENEGHLCARITKRVDGSLVTAQELAGSGFTSRAAGLLLGAALSTAAVHAQSTPTAGKAIVSGRFTAPNGGPLPAQGYVIFAANGQSIIESKTDQDGNWKAEIAPGMYDVIFRTSPFFGERINAVELHPGDQKFAAIPGRLALGHLGLVDRYRDNTQTFTTGGDLATSYRYPISYLFKRPLRYLKHLPHNFS
ncbi:hypothetical protein HDF16_003761 [Granulicella aggregans]|uniref:Carboxypeptidase regulatory-like domain-containing protein n=1 Tax=Granulicella aggregans TaxID=474949 RepID=A0A7W7ZG01_9BACT|nr:carboxypeptidase-like regulatory domain-containing protein [Granulicella aggregans]MBB5059038.1 hypothetical protein [Granulicella aggregans]